MSRRRPIGGATRYRDCAVRSKRVVRASSPALFETETLGLKLGSVPQQGVEGPTGPMGKGHDPGLVAASAQFLNYAWRADGTAAARGGRPRIARSLAEPPCAGSAGAPSGASPNSSGVSASTTRCGWNLVSRCAPLTTSWQTLPEAWGSRSAGSRSSRASVPWSRSWRSRSSRTCRRFASAKHAPSYAGLVPSTYQSGACDRHGHITKPVSSSPYPATGPRAAAGTGWCAAY